MLIPEVETERLLLRGFVPNDLDAYASMCADPEVTRYLGGPVDRGAAWRSMALYLGHWQLRGYGQWALVERSTGEFVGRAGLWEPLGWPGLEVGWALARPHWGRGLATEAARAALAHAFTAVGVDHVISLIDPRNAPSIGVAERLGEHYRRTIEVHGHAAHVYAIDR